MRANVKAGIGGGFPVAWRKSFLWGWACIASLSWGYPPAYSAEAYPAVADYATWAVDPQSVAEDLPPVGRSLFDYLVTEERNGQRVYNVPYPYTELVKKIEERLQGPAHGAAQMKHVLIPLGRSLQRNAAHPDFFRFPRVVSAVVTHPGPGGDQRLLLKDRLYIGFGEKSAVLEVISYNEAAGRFEFQVVNDYRPGGTARVAYANRAVCTSCHQNMAAIFSRQNWDETNANPNVAALLGKEGKEFHGVPVTSGVDIPFAIDQAADRANLFAVTQLLWRDGCGGDALGTRCRASAFALALQYRLSAEQGFDRASRLYRDDVGAVLTQRWRARWPGGLSIPDADLPNRNPLAAIQPKTRRSDAQISDARAKKIVDRLLAHTDISAAFEPLNPRLPKETWRAEDAAVVERFIAGLAEFIGAADVQRLDAQLFAQSGRSAARRFDSVCDYSLKDVESKERRVSFKCRATPGAGIGIEGRLYTISGQVTRGTIDRLIFGDGELRALEIDPAALKHEGSLWSASLTLKRGALHARRTDGHAIERMILTWRANGSGGGAVILVEDFTPVLNAIDEALKAMTGNMPDAFSSRPFRRARALPELFSRLGMPTMEWCCLDTQGMPPALDDRLPSPKVAAQ